MRFLLPALLATALYIVAPATAHAEADGPDFWAVQGVRSNDRLNMHRTQSPRSAVVARIPHHASGLRNLGCTRGPSFAQWEKMTAAERARSSRSRWCKVSYQGRSGWVAGRFLREGGAPEEAASASVDVTDRAAFGHWAVRCASGKCTVRQGGVGSARPASLVITPAQAPNAAIVLEHPALPASGTVTFFMDGNQVAAGPIAQLRSPDGKRLVFAPDDITLGLIRRMQTGKNLVVNFPGEDRGIEFRLDRFGEALQHARR